MPELLPIRHRGPRSLAAGPAPSFSPGPPDGLEDLKTFHIETWGCQMNEHDSEKMAGALHAMGLTPASGAAEADVVLLNTCSVREKAAHKVFTRLGQLRLHKLARPHMVLGVCGCVAQQEQRRIFRRAPYVDLVMGPRRISSLPELIKASRARRHVLGALDPRDALAPEDEAVRRVSRTRAYVTVMEGCNKTCTFCIVPFTRGREAYRAPASILREARECIDQGLPEIQLLGQNVNAWRYRGEGPADFAGLLGATAMLPGLKRLRFTTSHPLHFRDPIIDAMAAHPVICPHLHLPVQSGSDTVLARMRRGYTRADYLGRVARLREKVPGVALSTDIIVGFPGETEEDFRLTLDLVREVRYDSLYSFVYSPRPGTPATELPDDVPAAGKMERLHRVQELQAVIQAEQLRTWVGREVEVLVDGPSARGGQAAGRTGRNHLVNLEAGPEAVGRFLNVRITSAGPNSLCGAPVAP
ncbi:MAG: tRNA (N6-isopentenyl adenosine(37)-C2)-methylthiotransferase MiaB [Candidatus Polarisedimenticolia bacterium]